MTHSRIAHSVLLLESYLEETKQNSAYRLIATALDAHGPWRMTNDVLSHSSGGFFHVTGVRHRLHAQEEYLMFYQPQSAVTGLIVCKHGGEPMVLLQARIEPGNSYVVQYGPTIQSTAANYMQLHGGRPTTCAEYFLTHHADAQLITHSVQHDLGKRYFQKSKTHHYIEVKTLLPTEANMIWVPLGVLQQAFGHSNFLNTDLRSLLAVFDWDKWLGLPAKPFAVIDAKHALNRFYQAMASAPASPYTLCGLSQLRHWDIQPEGIVPKASGLPGVRMFLFESQSREVTQWVQPLLTVEGVGLVRQIVRRSPTGMDWLLQINREVGISTPVCVTATLVRHPEEKPDTEGQYEEGLIIRRMVQSDEGGRFMQNDTAYEVREVDSHWQAPAASHCWVPTILLKQWLASSNHCTIQLRNAASLLLDELCPGAFSLP